MAYRPFLPGYINYSQPNYQNVGQIKSPYAGKFGGERQGGYGDWGVPQESCDNYTLLIPTDVYPDRDMVSGYSNEDVNRGACYYYNKYLENRRKNGKVNWIFNYH